MQQTAALSDYFYRAFGATISFGASTILGRRIVKVDPRPGSLATVMSPDALYEGPTYCGIATQSCYRPPHFVSCSRLRQLTRISNVGFPPTVGSITMSLFGVSMCQLPSPGVGHN